jgi:FecR protein
MKKIHRYARNVVAGAAALLVAAFATQATAQTPVVANPSSPEVTAKVVNVEGKARVSVDGKGWQQVSKGDIIKPGSVIQTAGNGSKVDIVLGAKDGNVSFNAQPISNNHSGAGAGESVGQNVVRIYENSVLAIDKLTVEKNGADEVSETQLDLRAGQIMGNVKKLSAASKYEIKIPNGVAGIRGTTYLIAASGVVNVLTGSVVVAVVDKDGAVVTRVVSAGFRYDPASDKIMPIPTPQVKKLEDEYRRLNYPPQTPPTTYPKDHTIVYVSPNQ